jgi:integrase
MDALEIMQQAQVTEQPLNSEPRKSTEVEPIEPTAAPLTRGNLALNVVTMPKPTKAAKPKSEKIERVRGEGHLYKRGATFWFEIHFNGVRTRESLKTDDRQTAVIRMADRVADITRGIPTKVFEPVRVQEMFDKWMSEVERTCKPRTVQDYRSRWESHLKPAFGKTFATDITKQHVVDYLNARMREGAGAITQNRENRVLQMIFNHNKELIPANLFPTFPSMHSEKSHVRKGRLSSEDYATLLARLDDPKVFWLRAMLILTFKFGFRKGELLGAKCGWFDATTSVFTLPAYNTKNKMERRVPIQRDGDIFKMLVQLTEGRDADAALLTRNSKPVKDYRVAWKTLTAGITNGRGGHVTVHDLRRSAITGMSNKGIGADQAGTHLTPLVFSRYISRSESEEQAMAAKIEGD